MGDGVTLVSSRRGVAPRTSTRCSCAPTGCARSGEPTYSFATTGRPDEFETIGRRFLGAELLGASQFAGGLHDGAELTVVGCSGSYPGPDSPASCYLLEAEGTTVRAGPGPGASCSTSATARSASCTGTSTRSRIDAVFLSHLHADHCLDLCGYYVMRKYHPTGAQPRIPVWGPADTPGRMARAYDLPLDPGMTEEFDFSPPTSPSSRSARSASSPRRWCTRSTRSRSGSPSTAARSSTAGTPGPASRSTRPRRGSRPVPVRGVLPRRRRQPARPAHDGLRVRRRRRPRPGSGRLVLTHIPPWHDPRGRARRGADDVGRAGSSSPWPGWSPSSERASDQSRVVHDHGDLDAVGRRRACRRAATRAP